MSRYRTFGLDQKINTLFFYKSDSALGASLYESLLAQLGLCTHGYRPLQKPPCNTSVSLILAPLSVNLSPPHWVLAANWGSLTADHTKISSCRHKHTNCDQHIPHSGKHAHTGEHITLMSTKRTIALFTVGATNGQDQHNRPLDYHPRIFTCPVIKFDVTLFLQVQCHFHILLDQCHLPSAASNSFNL